MRGLSRLVVFFLIARPARFEDVRRLMSYKKGGPIFVAHNPKAGGVSLSNEVSVVAMAVGAKKSICECVDDGRTDESYTITQLRIPRYHVLSEYMMCKDKGPMPERMPDTIDDWVAHDFRPDRPKVHFDKIYHCYIPLNSQCNFYSRGWLADSDDRLEKAQEYLDFTANFVSVLEIFPMLVCVLHYVITDILPPWCPCTDDDRDEVVEAVPEKDTTSEEGGEHHELAHRDHGVGHIRWEELSIETQDRIDNITARDVTLYMRAIPRALRGIHYVQHATNTTLFCTRHRHAFRDTLVSGIPNFFTQLDHIPGGDLVRAELLRA